MCCDGGLSICLCAADLAFHALQSCGATHSHLPPLILAVNGLAGKPLLPMIGQLAMQGLLVKEVGPPQVTAVDDSPCVADRSRFRAVEWREVDRD